MDYLSTDAGNLREVIAEGAARGSDDFASMQLLEEILDLSGQDFDDDETWLYVPEPSLNLDQEQKNHLPPEFSMPKLKSTKAIDTRTFTRPKKKYSRPSINDIEQLYVSGCDGNDMNSSTEEKSSPKSKLPQTVQEEQETVPPVPSKPLQFDLTQPTSLHNFDSLLLNNSDIDSFQNMSPPSLVNSLCSSTFANLMESSFIKNDPVLREIRDKDFTETALLQDIEAPMFQSITESCSSLNSDTPESFLKKVTRDNTFRRHAPGLDNNRTITPERGLGGSKESSADDNATFELRNSSADSNRDNKNTTITIPPQTTEKSSPSTNSNSSPNFFGNLNGTYRRTPKHNGTFRRSDVTNKRLSLNLAYEKTTTNLLDRDTSRSIENNMNNSNKGSSDDLNSARTKSSARTVILQHGDSIEELKKRFSSSEGSVDLNRLSYCEEEEKADQISAPYKEGKISSELNRTVEIKRSPLGSADSLDRMSSLSSSSKGSNKVLSMEDVQAIVDMQERSLSQVMSTPKVLMGGRKKTLWEDNFISPIVANAKDALSDSELSDEYKSAKSQVSSKMSLDAWKKPSAKSLGYLAVNKDVKLKTSQRTSYTITGQKPLQALPNSIRGSYSNIQALKSTRTFLGGSQQNLYRPPAQFTRPTASSNLKTMGTKLKGSYTSLRPISSTLPVVPPVGSTLNGTHTITRPSTVSRTSMVNVNTVKIEVPSKAGCAQSAGDSTFTKPQIPRASGLPRPTGIPRPASRIPAPRSSNARPTSVRSVNY